MLLGNHLNNKPITESQDQQNFEMLLICSCITTLHSCYMKNALIFSQSNMHNFFIYIITEEISLNQVHYLTLNLLNKERK